MLFAGIPEVKERVPLRTRDEIRMKPLHTSSVCSFISLHSVSLRTTPFPLSGLLTWPSLPGSAICAAARRGGVRCLAWHSRGVQVQHLCCKSSGWCRDSPNKRCDDSFVCPLKPEKTAEIRESMVFHCKHSDRWQVT